MRAIIAPVVLGIGILVGSTTASACDDDLVDPTRVVPRSVDLHEPPFAVVSTGTNAPESLLFVSAATHTESGVQHVPVYAGPCARRVAYRTVVLVRSRTTLRRGELYFTVPPADFQSPNPGPNDAFALRRATPAEEAQYRSCVWR